MRMKKLFAGFFAIASVAAVGCFHEKPLTMSDAEEVFKGVIEMPVTRTSLGADGSTVWSDGDAVSIFKKSGYMQKYQVEAGGDAMAILKYADYSAKHNANLNQNYAVYPHSEYHTIDSQGNLTLDLSFLAEQSYAENTFENGKSVMVAKSTNSDLSFFNTLSMLRVKLCSEAPGDINITSITLTSATKALNGVATVDMSGDKQPAVFSSTAAENRSTTLNCDESVMLEVECDGTGGHDFYILVPAATFPANDLTVTVNGVDVNGEEVTYSSTYPAVLTLVRSGITTIHHKFEAADWIGVIDPKVEVATAVELIDALNNSGNIAVIELTSNIDLSGSAWTPVGTEEAPFTGVLNGNGNKISGLNISDTEYAAFIAYAGDNVTIKNLTLENVNIDSDKHAAGVVCVAGDGLKIDNVTVSGTITADSYAGGIVHNASNVEITNCVNNADISASSRAGGIASWVTVGANIENVTNNGSISGAIGASGIAHGFAGTIKNAVNNGTIESAGSEPASGIAGVQKGASTYEYCFNYGDVKSADDNPNSSAAGILGQTPGTSATLNYCANYGNITAEQSYAAGIAYSLYGSINASYCYNSGAIAGADGAGGIAPKAQFGVGDKANYCLNAGAVTSSSGLTYQASNNNLSCFYYSGNDLLNIVGNTAVTADDALAILNGGADNTFFSKDGDKVVVVR